MKSIKPIQNLPDNALKGVAAGEVRFINSNKLDKIHQASDNALKGLLKAAEASGKKFIGFGN